MDKYDVPLKIYFKAFFVKIIENLSSVKVWFFIWPFAVSTLFMWWMVRAEMGMVVDVLRIANTNITVLDTVYKSLDVISTTFLGWCTFNTSLVGTIVVVRETFKVSKLRAMDKSDSEKVSI